MCLQDTYLQGRVHSTISAASLPRQQVLKNSISFFLMTTVSFILRTAIRKPSSKKVRRNRFYIYPHSPDKGAEWGRFVIFSTFITQATSTLVLCRKCGTRPASQKYCCIRIKNRTSSKSISVLERMPEYVLPKASPN